MKKDFLVYPNQKNGSGALQQHRCVCIRHDSISLVADSSSSFIFVNLKDYEL